MPNAHRVVGGRYIGTECFIVRRYIGAEVFFKQIAPSGHRRIVKTGGTIAFLAR
nr:hypothetical protein [uncultured Campylobacter sp.]